MTKPKAPAPTTKAVTKPRAKVKAPIATKPVGAPYRPPAQIMELCKILKMKRPHGSATEDAFCKTYLEPIAGASKDGFGNFHVVVPPNKTSDRKLVLFSAHTDTVHADGGEQTVLIDEAKAEAFIDQKGAKGKDAFGACLGADDGTGCWILLNMIANNVPGYYIFHRAEECGGQGSAYIRDNWKKVMGKRTFDFAIAFDRKGTTEIITHQRGQRMASEKAAKQVAELFSKQNLMFHSSDGGSFTDTANYAKLIPECFNLAVGYYKQHGPNETQDLKFAEKMLEACLNVPWDELIAHRDPAVYEARQLPKQYNGGGWESSRLYDPVPPAKKKKKPAHTDPDVFLGPDTPASFKDLAAFISDYPIAAVALMQTLGVTEGDMMEAIENNIPDRLSLYNELTSRHFGS